MTLILSLTDQLSRHLEQKPSSRFGAENCELYDNIATWSWLEPFRELSWIMGNEICYRNVFQDTTAVNEN
jgi:hypothetical protein